MRHPGRVVVVLVALTACTGAPATVETTTTTTATATATATAAESTTLPPPTTTSTTLPPECAKPPYAVNVLPGKVSSDVVDPSTLERDEYLEVPGSSSVIWLDGEGHLAVALVRGTLPLDEWPGERGEVSIDGARGVAGPFPDGSWVVGWFEAPGERCDRFTMVFYPPVEPTEVQATIESMDRTAG